MTKLTGAPLQVATCLQDRMVNVTWEELQKELTINFSPLPYDNHASQAFTNPMQGPEEFLTKYVECSISLLTQINYTSDMSAISVLG